MSDNVIDQNMSARNEQHLFIFEGGSAEPLYVKKPHYKTIVPTESRKQLTNINGYTREVWQELISVHVSKMNYLVNGRFELPNKIESQELIFEKQLEKHILHKCPKVAVLSAFPVYVLDYFGADALKEKLEE